MNSIHYLIYERDVDTEKKSCMRVLDFMLYINDLYTF